MVTGALSLPSARSGCASGFIRSATGTLSAHAGRAKDGRMAAVSTMAVVLRQNSRRLMCNGNSVGV